MRWLQVCGTSDSVFSGLRTNEEGGALGLAENGILPPLTAFLVALSTGVELDDLVVIPLDILFDRPLVAVP